MEPRPDVVLSLLLNRAFFNSQLVDCYFNLTVGEKDSDLLNKIRELNSQTVVCLHQAIRMVLDAKGEMGNE